LLLVLLMLLSTSPFFPVTDFSPFLALYGRFEDWLLY
jgi:hypothetical protein